MKKPSVRKIKIALITIYACNLVYFSTTSFISEVTNISNVFFSNQYHAFLGNTGLYRVISFFKMNLAYAFFGHGLYAGTHIEFTYYDRNNTEIKSTDFSKSFKTRNGQLRAGNVSTIVSFNSLFRIKNLQEQKKTIDSLNNSSQWARVNNSIEQEEKMFAECMTNIGKYVGADIRDWNSFTAKFYYVIPNELSSPERGRSLYLFKKVDYSKND